MFSARQPALLLGFLLLRGLALCAQEPRQLRYDLRPGDHLVYRQTLERQVSGQQLDSSSRNSWTNHALVLDANRGALVIGFQRNRTSGELLRFKLNGQDRLKQGRKDMAERIARSPGYAEANRFDLAGWAQIPPQVVRETNSKALFDIREIMPLPPGPVRIGDRWEAGGLVPMSLTAAAWETLETHTCLRITGTSTAPDFSLRYWFCPESGLLQRLEIEVAYPAMSGGTTREKLSLELLERRRGEAAAAWLTSTEARHAALAALLVSDTLSIPAADLYALFDQPDTDAHRRVLGLAYRRRLPSPGLERLQTLLGSASPRVRALAVRMLEQHNLQEARPLIARALADADEFVRRAALAFVRSRLPARDALIVNTAEQALARWNQLSPSPLLEAEVFSGAPAPGGGAASSSSPACDDTALWSETVRRRRRASWQPVGTTPQVLEAEGFRGWPYFVRVPEDYRGDEPFPVLFYLSGNAGPASEGALLADDGVAGTGYLVIYPHAHGFWWHSKPTEMMSVLLDDVLRRFNVDTRRVYLTGLSNGGTGAFYYSTLWPHRFAAAVSAMGAGLWVPELEKDNELLPRNSDHVPLLFLHGAGDEVIQADATRDTVESLAGRPAPLESHIFPERGHEIVLGRGDEGMTLDFFRRFERNPFPRTLNFQARTLRAPRLYWLEMLEKDDGLAEVKAEIEKDNTIRLSTRRVRRLRLLLRPELLAAAGPVRVLLNGKEVFTGDLPAGCATLHRSLQQTGDPLLAWSAELVFEVPR